MADLNWSWPPPVGDILASTARALFERIGLYIGELPASLSGHGGKILRVRADETGLELVAGATSVARLIRAITANTTLGESHLDVRRDSTGAIEHSVLLVRHSTPSTAITVTLPANAAAGDSYTLVQALDQTGTVTLEPASGATLHGGTSSVTLDGPGAVATAICVSNTAGSNAAYVVLGQTSLGQLLTGVTTLGENKGGYRALGNAITSSVTLGSDDVGTEREITASSAVTITVPSGFRGEAYLRNVSSVSHTVALTGVGSKTLGTNALGIVDGNGTRLGLRIQTYA